MNRVLPMQSAFAAIVLVVLACGHDDPAEVLKREMLSEVNKLRTSGCICGEDTMPPVQEVVWDESLTIAAKRHLNDMIDNDFFNHIGSDGSTPASRASDAGFEGAYIGENIARGYINVQDVMNRWKNSENHCKTIMDFHYLYLGFAADQYYWVQLFGSD